MKKFLLISLTVHLLLILSVRGCGGRGGSSGNGDNTNFIPKSDDPQLISQLDIHATEPQPKKKKEKPCKEFYGGIGLSWSPALSMAGEAEIQEVPEGYPAWKAGIRPGDIIVSEASIQRGEVGTKVSFTVVHQDGTSQDITLTREKICVDEIKKPQPPAH